MEFEQGIEVINTAYQKRGEERLFYRWLLYQDSMSFEEFKNKLDYNISETQPVYNTKSVDEIMTNVECIVEAVHNGNI